MGDLGGRFGRSGLEIWDFWVSDLGDPSQRSGRSGSFPQHEGVSWGLHPLRDQFLCSTTTTSMGIRCPKGSEAGAVCWTKLAFFWMETASSCPGWRCLSSPQSFAQGTLGTAISTHPSAQMLFFEVLTSETPPRSFCPGYFPDEEPPNLSIGGCWSPLDHLGRRELLPSPQECQSPGLPIH